MAFNGYGMPRLDLSSLATIGQAPPSLGGASLADVGQLPPSAKNSWLASVTGPAGTSITDRDKFQAELSDPRVFDRLAAMTRAEVGGQGPQAQQAFIETIFNRAAARGQSLSETLSGSYFPAVTHNRAARGVNDDQRGYYRPIVDQVVGGSNLANFATGNASGNVGFAGGPQTSAYSGERFGVEGPDRSWARRMGFK